MWRLLQGENEEGIPPFTSEVGGFEASPSMMGDMLYMQNFQMVPPAHFDFGLLSHGTCAASP